MPNDEGISTLALKFKSNIWPIFGQKNFQQFKLAKYLPDLVNFELFFFFGRDQMLSYLNFEARFRSPHHLAYLELPFVIIFTFWYLTSHAFSKFAWAVGKLLQIWFRPNFLANIKLSYDNYFLTFLAYVLLIPMLFNVLIPNMMQKYAESN